MRTVTTWEHLTTKAQFSHVYSRGRSRAGSLLVVKLVPNGLGVNRYGFVTSKHLGKAVRRNKVRRWLRESVRQLPTKPGWDIVFIPRRAAVEADYHAIRSAAIDLLSRSGVLGECKESENEKAGTSLNSNLSINVVAS